MIKEGSDFFQNGKFCPILIIYDLPDNQHVQFCMNSKFDAILQPVITFVVAMRAMAFMQPNDSCKGSSHINCLFSATQ